MCLPQDVFFCVLERTEDMETGTPSNCKFISSSGSRRFRVQDFGGPGLRA